MAESRDISFVVMATHSRHGWQRLVQGSIAARVIRTANVPVLLCPPHLPFQPPCGGDDNATTSALARQGTLDVEHERHA